MSDRRGIFSLEEFYDLQVSGETSTISDTFIYVTSVNPAQTAGPNMGYWAGGAYGSVVDRVDFSNDTPTASVRGNLSVGRTGLGNGGSTPSYGYAFAGAFPGPNSSVDRVDYSNDSAVSSPKGPLSYARSSHSTITNTNYGYTGGGWPGPYSTIDRLDYANDTATAASLGNIMVPSGRDYATTGNQSYGYLLGGYDPSLPQYRSTVRRIDYSNDTATTSPRGSLRDICGDNSATGNANYGFIKGGGNATRGPIEVLDFANDTATPATTTSNILTVGAYNRGATGNADYGWFGGGDPPNRSYVDRIDYSNYTAAAVTKGPLTVARGSMATFSAREHGLPQTTSTKSFTPATRTETYPAGGPNYGYIAGGDPSSTGGTYIYRIDFDSDTTTAAPKGNLYVSRKSNSEGAVGNGSYGYFAGGWSPGHLSSIDRMDYGNDTATATPKGNLANPGNNWAAAGNTNYGWIAAGQSPSTNYMTSINRMDYSNDTGTTVRGNTDNYHRIGTAGNLDYGYWAGGGSPKTSRTVRLDYSNDTVWGTTKGPLNASKYNVEGAGNANYGYFAGGATGVPSQDPSVVDRLDYSNDTATASPRGNLSGKMSDDAATANGSYGYFAPGPSGQPNKRSIDRVDFSNDTATASPRGNIINDADGRMGISPLENGLPSPTIKTVDKGAAGYTTSIPSPAYGYFAGSYNNRSSVDRVDYNNDTATASPKGNLPSDASQGGGAGNRSYGYTFTGWAPGISTTVYRVDYANDTAAAATKGPVSKAGNYARSVGNANYGYTGGRGGGGVGPTDNSLIDRVDYANDTATATVVNATGMDPGARIVAAVGNQSYGYFAGGTPGTSVVRRLDYSSDTTATSPKGPLSAVRGYCGPGTGNADYGYVLGKNPSQGPSTDVERIDYSNDTATALMRGKTSTDTGHAHPASISGVSNPTYAYFGGADPALTHIDRIEFSNDTSNASPKGNLATARKSPYSFSAQNSGLPSTTYIPRIRWFDIKEETDAIPGTSAGNQYGYFAGGTSAQSKVDRIDFDNDTATASPRGNMVQTHYRGGGTGNQNSGYCFGGGSQSWVSRVDYASDTVAVPARGPLYTPADYCSSIGNNDFGYTGGRPWSYYYYLGKVDYSNDTATETLLGTSAFGPSPSSYGYAGVGNRSYGYFAGGSSSTMVRRVDYSNDTATASLKGPLTATSSYASGTGNGDYGYVTVGPWSNQTLTCRIDYSNDTPNAVNKGSLAGATGYRTATGNANYGYWAGGTPGTYGGTKIYRVDYANDTAVAPEKGSLSIASYRQQGFSSRENGNPNIPTAPTPAFRAPIQPPFPFPVQGHNPAGYGYFVGGYDGTNPSGPTGDLTIVQRIDFSNDTATASLRGNLSSTPGSMKSTSSNKNYGYAVGGSTIPTRSYVDRIDYANDSATTTPRGPLGGPGRGATAGAGNNDYGYHTGGIYVLPSRTVYSNVERIDYSNDSSTTSPKGPLIAARGYHNATGTLNYGYFAAGSPNGVFGPNSSTVQRIDYGNDTTTSSTKGPLSHSTSQLGSTGNANYGWFIAGYGPANSQISRVDYANDTATASARGPLYQPSYRLEGTGNANYGYVHPGLYPGNPAGPDGSTDVARIDYSNDTTTTATKGHFARAYTIQEGGVSAAENGRT